TDRSRPAGPVHTRSSVRARRRRPAASNPPATRAAGARTGGRPGGAAAGSGARGSRFELLGGVATEQVARGVGVEAVADPAQVADQAAQFAQGRAELGETVVGEAVDRRAVLVEDRVRAARG